MAKEAQLDCQIQERRQSLGRFVICRAMNEEIVAMGPNQNSW
jgi:hypothetical protein